MIKYLHHLRQNPDHLVIVLLIIVLGLVTTARVFVYALDHNVGGLVKTVPQEPNSWLGTK